MGEITTANALLEVTNVRNSVGNGTTKPHYGVIDEKLCVIKGINNPEKHLVLFNEYFGYSLAKILGLNTPDFGFALISHKTLFDDERKKKYFIPGCLCFFTTYIEKTVLLRGVKQLSGAEESDLLGILLFDLLICNIDRNPGNLLLRKPKNQNLTMYPIDYTHAFELQAIWDQGQLSRYVKEPREEIDLERIHTQRIHQDIKEAKTFRAENIEGCISYF
ncbi:HipA family kinase [Listeria fleischmannii]|uniref:HipA-like kinase domain-containing protein n=1 Tax=Listeria fleischmannii FSL S10-1203 TaxID=1265822 RepID=W7DT35_9LIST|nr:HipA family kinase [Listeria fleischmannii]EUJ56611.1 hypothetical protein MCOL2_08796 [Listeria fleischmannii FSL S10-1203]